MILYNRGLTNNFINYLNDNAEDVETTHEGARANLEAWAEAKTWLYDNMSKCDGWSAEDYSIIKRGLVCTIPSDERTYMRMYYNLLDALTDMRYYAKADAFAKYSAVIDLVYNLYFNESGLLKDHDEARLLEKYKSIIINNISEIDTLKNIRVGAGVKKALLNIMLTALKDFRNNLKSDYVDTIGARIDNWANGWAAKGFDALKERTKTYDLRLSINPLDFVSMSESDYFSSCHRISDGCYRQGCLSYMNDGASIIVKVYEADAVSVEDMPTTRDFIARLVVCLNDSAVIISRCYPLGDNVQALIDSIRAETLKALNLSPLKTFASLDELSDYGINVYDNGAHYRDYKAYNWTDNGGIVAYALKESSDNLNYLEIGASAYCLTCGEYLDEDEEEALSCCCYIYCEECGERVRRENAYNVNGYWYGEDCVAWCERCEEYHHRDDVHEFDGQTLCADCIRDLL
jgi:hypothetical protein